MSIGNILLIVVSVTTIVSYLPQVIKTLKTKSSEDLSVASWTIWLISATAYVFYAVIASDDPMLIVATGLELFFCVVILILAIRYRNS